MIILWWYSSMICILSTSGMNDYEWYIKGQQLINSMGALIIAFGYGHVAPSRSDHQSLWWQLADSFVCNVERRNSKVDEFIWSANQELRTRWPDDGDRKSWPDADGQHASAWRKWQSLASNDLLLMLFDIQIQNKTQQQQQRQSYKHWSESGALFVGADYNSETENNGGINFRHIVALEGFSPRRRWCLLSAAVRGQQQQIALCS